MLLRLSRMKCLLCLVIWLVIYTNIVEAVHDADHIFNVIHSSMRQWGSSLNHNGVSFFRALVPKGVQLHHGTWRPDRVEGMEWLAFEPEHAMNFAFKICDEAENSISPDVGFMSPKWWPQQAIDSHLPVLEPGQEVLGAPQRPRPHPPLCIEPGWLHTYTPTRDLRLLYIDGMSAGKTSRGTLDSQDFVLLWNSSVNRDPNNPIFDLERARGLCQIAQDDFESKVDGFIRMEHGFEIILCDFSLLEVNRILRPVRDFSHPGPIGRDELDAFSFMRAITSRYSGIGGRRVCIDYDHFVTAFNHPEIDLWPDGNEQPRLNKISRAAASALFDEVKQMVLSDYVPVEEQIDWQNIADMYVDRYARPIQNLVSSNFKEAEVVHNETRRLFQPYLNQTLANRDATIQRCQQAYIPAYLVDNANPSLGQQVIEQGTYHLCSYLHRVLMDKEMLELQKSHLRLLMDTLKWTAWKDCQPACALNEICFTAIWPFGTQEDHDKPSCLNATAIRGRFGYWNGFPRQ